MASVTAPTTEIGYTQAPNYNWWLYENETTPELVWPQSIYVFDQMRRTDAQVGSVLRAVTETLLRTPWRIDPAGARARVTKFVADDLGLPVVGKPTAPPPRLKDRFSWSTHLREALLMLPYGHSYFEQVYRVTPDGSAAHLRKLAYRPAKTIERIDVAPDGGLIAIKQYWTQLDREPQPIPVNHLVAYIHAKEGGNWLGTSILRNCYKNWLLKDRLLRVQAQTVERNGMGIPLYKAQEGASGDDLIAGKAMATAWRAGEAAGSAVPFGADLVLRGVEGTLPDAQPAIDYHDSQIARAVLAHFLNLGAQTGSWALGTTFADFFTMSLQTLAEQIRDTATQHIVEDLVDINFGENEPAPRLVFDEIGSRQAATAMALKTLVDAGVIRPDEVLEESSRQQYGLPPADPATLRTPPAPTPGADQMPAPTQTGDMSVAAAMADPKGVAAPDAVEARFNPAQSRVPGGEHGGEWSATGAIKDLLKLAEKADLQPGEHLVGSDKVTSDSGMIRIALVDHGGHKSLRLGIGGDGFGGRDDEAGPWRAGPDHTAAINDERKKLRDEEDALRGRLAELESKPGLTGAEQGEKKAVEKRLDQLDEMPTGDVYPRGFTAEIDPAAAGQLKSALADAMKAAEAKNKEINHFYDQVDALDAQRAKLRGLGRKWTPEEEARWESLTRQFNEAQQQAAAFEYTIYAEGVVPGRWADIHYRVDLDDTSVGPEVQLAAVPHGSDEDLGDLLGNDQAARLDLAEGKKLLRLLNRFTGSVSAAAGREPSVAAMLKMIQAAAGHDVTPGHDELHHYWTKDPRGLGQWVDSPKPWTTLVALLTPHVGLGKAKVFASRWFIEVFGYSSGSDKNRVAHGHPPRGHRVGPG